MFNDINSVREARNGDVILVGEDHASNELFRDLARAVINEYQPGTAAIELSRPGNNRPCAIGEVTDFARQTGVPLLAIDSRWRSYAPLDVNTNGIYSVINNVDTADNGSYNPSLLGGVRTGTRRRYGQEVFDAVFTNRERDMAGRLHWALDEGYPTPIVVACGYYHVKYLQERLNDADHERIPIENERIGEYQ